MSMEAPDTLPAGTLLDGVRLERRLDSGTTAAVYAGQHLGFKIPVAVKFLHLHLASDPVAVERFNQEAQICARFNHQSLVRVFDFGEYQGVPYLVMEWLDGESLRQYQSKRGKLPEKQVVSIALWVLSALSRAHLHGVVHRDISPSNIYLCRDGTVRLIDFGLAQFPRDARLTHDRTPLGTPFYMSPEQVNGQAESQSDLYGLALVMYEMLTGTVPFDGQAVTVLYKQINETLPALPSSVSSVVREVIEKAASKDFNARYASAGAMYFALKQGGVPAPAVPEVPTEVPRISRRAEMKAHLWEGLNEVTYFVDNLLHFLRKVWAVFAWMLLFAGVVGGLAFVIARSATPPTNETLQKKGETKANEETGKRRASNNLNDDPPVKTFGEKVKKSPSRKKKKAALSLQAPKKQEEKTDLLPESPPTDAPPPEDGNQKPEGADSAETNSPDSPTQGDTGESGKETKPAPENQRD